MSERNRYSNGRTLLPSPTTVDGAETYLPMRIMADRKMIRFLDGPWGRVAPRGLGCSVANREKPDCCARVRVAVFAACQAVKGVLAWA